MKYTPHPYQQTAEDFIESVHRCMLAMEMGLGKTVVTATAFHRWLMQLCARQVLVVGPKRVVENVWPREFQKWDHLRDLTYATITGSESDRVRAAQSPALVHLVNRENLAWLAARYVGRGKRWPYDCVVVDESGSFKSRDSRRWQALHWARKSIRRLILLTGTPVSNSHVDLWAQMALIDGGQRLFPTITAFRHHACREDVGAHRWLPKDDAAKRWIEAQVADVVLSMRATDWLDMPELLTIDVQVPLPERAMVAYREMVKEMQAEVAGEVITAANAGAKAGKLAQMAGGAVYDASGVPQQIHEAKLDALEDLVEGLGGEPTIVAYIYKHELTRLRARFPQGRSSSEPGALDAWNRGEVPILWLQAGSDGYGLNLQDGGHHLIWYTLPYGKLDDYLQTIARLWRQGQRRGVVCHRLLAEKTIDAHVERILRLKGQDLADFMRAMLRS